MSNSELNFTNFLKDWVIENNHFLQSKETSTGETIIAQTQRNQMRRAGMDALKEDLINLYGDEFDIVETASGLNIVAENDEGTVTWELKCTIKALSYDPFEEANKFDDLSKERAKRKEEINKRKSK